MSRADKELVPGRIVAGRWQVESRLAEGGMGSVYVACHTETARQVVLEVVRGSDAMNQGVLARVRRESAAPAGGRSISGGVMRWIRLVFVCLFGAALLVIPGCTCAETDAPTEPPGCLVVSADRPVVSKLLDHQVTLNLLAGPFQSEPSALDTSSSAQGLEWHPARDLPGGWEKGAAWRYGDAVDGMRSVIIVSTPEPAFAGWKVTLNPVREGTPKCVLAHYSDAGPTRVRVACEAKWITCPSAARTADAGSADGGSTPPNSSRIGGNVETRGVQAVFRRREEAFQACYVNALKANSNLQGKIVLDFTIGDGGRVVHARIAKDELGSAQAANCVIAVMKRLSFPAPVDGEVTLSKTFVFQPSGSSSSPDDSGGRVR